MAKPPQELQSQLDILSACHDLTSASKPLKAIGEALGLPRPAVIDDYSVNSLLTAEDGQRLAESFGWEAEFINDWIERRLHRVSPIGQVCRIATKPFAWGSAALANSVAQSESAPRRGWHLTPERGIHGGITVPLHLPLCRVGAVSWVSLDRSIDLQKTLERHGDLLRLAAAKFMDLVYESRVEAVIDVTRAPLTEREVECLTWVALGKTDIEIGLIINRSPSTARFHVEKAVEKLGASNRTQAVAVATQLGLIRTLR